MLDSQRLMQQNKENLENALDDLRFILHDCGFELKGVKILPRPSTKACDLVKSKGVEVL